MDSYQRIWQKIVAEVLADQCLCEVDAAKLVEMRGYRAIEEIRKILADASLNDANCFWEIEKNVCCLEDCGLSCGARHDF